MRLLRKSMRKFIIFLLVELCFMGLNAQALRLLPQGHAHNDYKHARPLSAALEAGYTSLEIDVYSKKGVLRVAHWPLLLANQPRLGPLYLAPLRARIAENGGTVFPGDSTQLVLMIDLKRDVPGLYTLLRAEFSAYLDLIETHSRGQVRWGPLKVVLSGGPPLDSLLAQEVRYFSADGNPSQWARAYSPELMPRGSTNFRSHFKWRGKGKMPLAEQQKLAKMVAKAHLHQRKIRFWATPDSPAVWKALLDAGVDWINVDDLENFRKFYLQYTFL